MKVFKFLKVALVTGALAAMMVVPAFAQYKPFEFDLYIDDGNAAHSAINTKDDNEQTAYVYVENGNIASSDRLTMQIVAPYDDAAYSYSQNITSNSATYRFNYIRYVGKNGGSRIYAVTHKLDVWVSGHWHS